MPTDSSTHTTASNGRPAISIATGSSFVTSLPTIHGANSGSDVDVEPSPQASANLPIPLPTNLDNNNNNIHNDALSTSTHAPSPSLKKSSVGTKAKTTKDDSNVVKKSEAVVQAEAQRSAVAVAPRDDVAHVHAGNVGTVEDVETAADYDINPTQLFKLIQNKQWEESQAHLEANPHEAKVWIYRRQTITKQSQSGGTNAGNAVVVSSSSSSSKPNHKLRWKLLPLHAALVFQAPDEFVEQLILLYPLGAAEPDDRGLTPLHLVFRHNSSDEVMRLVLTHASAASSSSSSSSSSPECCISMEDHKGRRPIDMIGTTATAAAPASGANKAKDNITNLNGDASNNGASARSGSGLAYFVRLTCQKERAQLEQQQTKQIERLEHELEERVQTEVMTVERALIARYDAQQDESAAEWKAEYDLITEDLAKRHDEETHVLAQQADLLQQEQEHYNHTWDERLQAQLDAQLQTHQVKESELLGHVQNLEQVLEESRATTRTVEEEVATLQEEVATLKTEQTAAEEARLLLMEEKNGVMVEREDLRTQKDALSADSKALATTNAELTQKVTSLQEEVTSLQEEVELSSRTIHDMTLTQDKTSTGLKHLTEIREANDMAMARIVEENRQLVRQVDDANARHAEELRGVADQARRFEEDNETLQQQVLDLRQSSTDDMRKHVLTLLHSSASSSTTHTGADRGGGFDSSVSGVVTDRESIFRGAGATNHQNNVRQESSQNHRRASLSPRKAVQIKSQQSPQHQHHARDSRFATSNANSNSRDRDAAASRTRINHDSAHANHTRNDDAHDRDPALTLLDERKDFMESLARLKHTINSGGGERERDREFELDSGGSSDVDDEEDTRDNETYHHGRGSSQHSSSPRRQTSQQQRPAGGTSSSSLRKSTTPRSSATKSTRDRDHNSNRRSGEFSVSSPSHADVTPRSSLQQRTVQFRSSRQQDEWVAF
jgi:hypothetical protein